MFFSNGLTVSKCDLGLSFTWCCFLYVVKGGSLVSYSCSWDNPINSTAFVKETNIFPCFFFQFSCWIIVALQVWVPFWKFCSKPFIFSLLYQNQTILTTYSMSQNLELWFFSSFVFILQESFGYSQSPGFSDEFLCHPFQLWEECCGDHIACLHLH